MYLIMRLKSRLGKSAWECGLLSPRVAWVPSFVNSVTVIRAHEKQQIPSARYHLPVTNKNRVSYTDKQEVV